MSKSDFEYWKIIETFEYNIYLREEIPVEIIENADNPEEWRYGYLKKSHYIVNGKKELIGCLDLIFMSIYEDAYIFYIDTIEIRKEFRRHGFGTKLLKFLIETEKKKYKNLNLFLLVANCEQYKLKFFNSLRFTPIKLRKTKVGTHCIMCYPFHEKSEKYCKRLFDYFNWIEEKKEIVPSDCKYAYSPNPTGLNWCSKKNIYVTGLEKRVCQYYEEESKLFFKKNLFNSEKVTS